MEEENDSKRGLLETDILTEQLESPEKKDLPMKKRLKGIVPVLLFLPLLIFMSSDSSILLANQILILAEFEIESFRVLGAIIAVGQVTLAVSTLMFGYMADKFVRKKILFAGGLIWSIGELLCALAPSPTLLLVFRIISAFGAGCAAPVTMSLLSDIFPSKKRGNSFAWWGLATTIGSLGGGSIALAFNQIDLSFAPGIDTLSQRIQYIITNYTQNPDPNIARLVTFWRYPFILMAIFGLVSCILILLVKEPKRGIAEESLHDVLVDGEIDYSHSYRIKLEDLKKIYVRKSNFWLIVNFVDTIFFGLLVGFLFLWLEGEVGIQLDISSILDKIWILLPFLVILLGFLLWGQFWFAKKGDEKVEKGDYAGRVKIAVFCGVVHIPFLMAAFFLYADLGNFTFFKGGLDLSDNLVLFTVVFIAFGLLLGLGLGIEFGVTPAWYSSMIDVNVPEHRGTMIAAAAFMDAIGRGIGAWVGSWLTDLFSGPPFNSAKPISDAIIFCTLTFGVISGILWLPILKHAKHDFKEVHDILEERAEKLKEEKKKPKEKDVKPEETKNSKIKH